MKVAADRYMRKRRGIALAEGDVLPRILASEMLPGRSASERLLPVIRERMEAAGWKLNELAAIGVVNWTRILYWSAGEV